MSYDFDAYFLPNINILRDYGVPESNIVLYLQRLPSIFVISPGVFKPIVEEVKRIVFNPLLKKFMHDVSFLRNNSKWQRKFDIFKKWGWSEQVILNAFLMDPHLMEAAEEKIMTTMDFFVNRMGFQSLFIANHPKVFGYSLEKRIVPRGLFVLDLLSKGLIKKFELYTLYNTSEKVFLQMFVYRYGDDKAPELLKMYENQVERAAAEGKYRTQQHS